MKRFTSLSLIVASLVLFAGKSHGARFVRSDTNNDGEVTIVDPVRALGFLFLGRGTTLGCLDAADSNDDGELDVSDTLFTLSFLFLGGPAPSLPFPRCGVDPTADELDCADYAPCRVPNIRQVLGDCGGVPTTEYPNSLKPGNGLRKVTLGYVDAVCNDGSPAVLYVRSASEGSPYADRWIIYLQGGGGCSSFEDCLQRWCSIESSYDESKMSSLYTPNSIAGTGLFSRAPENAFGEFNQVYMYYCSSDSWSGRANDSVLTDPEDPSRRFSLHFRGHTILAAAVTALQEGGLESDDGTQVMPSLADAASVLLSGFSGGSGGVLHNGDWVASILEPNGTDVRLFRDAGVWPDPSNHPDPTVVPDLERTLEVSYREAWEEVYAPKTWNAFVDESCRAHLAGNDQEWRAVDKNYVQKNHITTPFFAQMDLADRPTRERWVGTYGVDLGAFLTMTEQTLRDLQTLPADAFEGSDISRTPGVFGPLCGTHTGHMSNTVFFERTVEDAGGTPRTLHDSLWRWMHGGDVAVIDNADAPTTVCGPEEPERE